MTKKREMLGDMPSHEVAKKPRSHAEPTESILKKKRLSEATGQPKAKEPRKDVLTYGLFPGWKPIATKEYKDPISPLEPKTATHTSEREKLDNWMSSLSTNQVISTDTERALGKSKPSGITQAEQLLGESPPYSPVSVKPQSSSSSSAGEKAVIKHIVDSTNHQGASSSIKSVTQVWVRQMLGHWGFALACRVSHLLVGALDVFKLQS